MMRLFLVIVLGFLAMGSSKFMPDGKYKCVNVLSMQTYKSGKDPTAIATDTYPLEVVINGTTIKTAVGEEGAKLRVTYQGFWTSTEKADLFNVNSSSPESIMDIKLPNIELFLVNKKGEMITARATKSGAKNYLYECEKR